jgi:NAD+--asparagine ADP-ribosyltransferase
MIKLTDLVKGYGKFEQGVVYSNPYHTAFKSQVKEEVLQETTARFDFAQASGVEFMASSNNGKIVLIPKSIKDKSKIETVISKLGNGGEDDFLSLVQIRLEKKLGLKVIADKRYSGAGYAFEIDMDTLLKKL